MLRVRVHHAVASPHAITARRAEITIITAAAATLVTKGADAVPADDRGTGTAGGISREVEVSEPYAEEVGSADGSATKAFMSEALANVINDLTCASQTPNKRTDKCTGSSPTRAIRW
eukprot:988596-Prorocentrum_minimum.AAC.1